MSLLKHRNIKYEIASPCEQSWSEMKGDDKCRFCNLCEKNVYNLSSMNSEEVDKLLASDKNICTRVFQRPDGTVLTEDCPIGLKQVRKHLKEKRFLTAALCLITIIQSNLVLAGNNRRLMGKIAVAPIQKEVENKKIETVGPEENWDYENKEVENKEEIEPLPMMGAMIEVERD